MRWQGLTNGEDRRLVKRVVGLVLGGWFLVVVLPAIALWTPLFPVKSKDDVENIKSVLQQFGTYGDFFGVLNCLFSGLALIGVAYAVVLQSRDLHNQQEDMERNAKASEVQIQLQREEMERNAEASKLQSRLQQEEMERNAGASELQNRLAAYQSLADHHRDRRNTAGRDSLLAARSRGRETAYAELMKLVLLQIEGRRSEHPYGDHPARVRNLRNQYETDRHLILNHEDEFGPVREHLLHLVEEIAALVELVRNNPAVDTLLEQAGHAVNAAVEPERAMDQPEATAEQIRAYQIEVADTAFRSAVEAVRALGFDIP